MIAERIYRFPNAAERDPGWLSPSQVVRYMTCPACFEAERILRIPKPLSINLPIGGATHKAVEFMRMERMAQRQVKLNDAIEFAVEHFESEVSVPVDDESGVELVLDLGSTYKSLDQAKDKVADLTRYALPLIAQLDDRRGGVSAVELDLFNFPQQYPFAFHGRMDVLYGGSGFDPTTATLGGDLKTSKDRQKAPDVYAAIQLTLYAEHCGVPMVADVVSKTQPPEFHSYDLQASAEQIVHVHQIVLDVADGIMAGRFPPRPSYLCNYSHGLPEFRQDS